MPWLQSSAHIGCGFRQCYRRSHFVVLALALGCGTMREQQATQQLLLSDAVDRSVSRIDFRGLAGEKIFLDAQYLKPSDHEFHPYVNVNYVISSLRQQMFLAGCLLQEERDAADYIVEPRLGTLGSDGHDINYGVPASNTLNAAAAVVGNAPPLPTLPEISLGRRTESTAAAKIAVFAYHRETRRPVWQSGLSVGKSNASGRWILGAGPFQSGTIYDGTQFAGEDLVVNPLDEEEQLEIEVREELEKTYRDTAVLDPKIQQKLNALPAPLSNAVKLAAFEESIAEDARQKGRETAATRSEERQ